MKQLQAQRETLQEHLADLTLTLKRLPKAARVQNPSEEKAERVLSERRSFGREVPMQFSEFLQLLGVLTLGFGILGSATWGIGAVWRRLRLRRVRRESEPVREELEQLRTQIEALQEHLAELTLALDALPKALAQQQRESADPARSFTDQ